MKMTFLIKREELQAALISSGDSCSLIFCLTYHHHHIVQNSFPNHSEFISAINWAVLLKGRVSVESNWTSDDQASWGKLMNLRTGNLLQNKFDSGVILWSTRVRLWSSFVFRNVSSVLQWQTWDKLSNFRKTRNAIQKILHRHTSCKFELTRHTNSINDPATFKAEYQPLITPPVSGEWLSRLTSLRWIHVFYFQIDMKSLVNWLIRNPTKNLYRVLAHHSTLVGTTSDTSPHALWIMNIFPANGSNTSRKLSSSSSRCPNFHHKFKISYREITQHLLKF